MSEKSAFGEALNDLYYTYCDRKGLTRRDRGVSQFQVDAETGPGTLDRVLRGDRQWVSSRMIETILDGLYNEGDGIISQGEQALWRKHLHTMRVLTILVHSFRTDVIEDDAAVLPEPLVDQLKAVSHRSYETVIASVTKTSEKKSGTQEYARAGLAPLGGPGPREAAPADVDQRRGYRPTGSAARPLRDADDDGFAPFESPFDRVLEHRNDVSLNDRTSKLGDAHLRALKRRQLAQQSGEVTPAKRRTLPQPAPGQGLPMAAPRPAKTPVGPTLRERWRQWRSRHAGNGHRAQDDEPAAAPQSLNNRRYARPLPRRTSDPARKYPLTLDWREVVAWLADREPYEIVCHRRHPSQRLLLAYLHARDGIEDDRGFTATNSKLRWEDDRTGFWVERPLETWERVVFTTEAAWVSSPGAPINAFVQAGDALAIMRQAIGATCVDHVVGAVRAQQQIRAANPVGSSLSSASEQRWSSVGDD